MNKNECKACNKAKIMLAHYDEMIMNNENPSLQDMRDYNTVMKFFENMMIGEVYNEYNRDFKGAVYPETVPTVIVEKTTMEQNNTSLTSIEFEAWVKSMYNNIHRGAKWSMAETSVVARQYGVNSELVSDMCWWAVMNMIYTDYYKAAIALGMVDNVKFYAELSKSFLFDDDGYSPKEKLSRYYHCVVYKK